MAHRFVSFFFYLGYSFLYLPIFLIILYSFNSAPSALWQNFSLRWYTQLIQDPAYWEGAVHSFQIALISATLAVLLGTMCASLWTRPGANHRFLGFVASMPLVFPDIVTGFSILLVCIGCERFFGWPQRGIATITIAHATLGAAYAVVIIRNQLLSLNPALSEAARDLGARPYKVFFLIKLPLIAPALIASWLIAFMLSFDDVVLASFTSGPGVDTLPMVIFASLKKGSSPVLNALATGIILMVSLLILISSYIFYRKGREWK